MPETTTIRLICCDAKMLEAAITGDETIGALLGVSVAETWSSFGTAPLQYALDKIRADADSSAWWTYFPIHKTDNCLIGTCGYKGAPSEEGVVEFGYEIAPSYRNRGLATEVALGLIAHAFTDPRVKTAMAHTLAEENASVRVLTKCGFKKVAEINDPDDGLIWKWELEKTTRK